MATAPARAARGVREQGAGVIAGRSASLPSSTDAARVSQAASAAVAAAAVAARKKRTSNVFWIKLNFTVKTARLQSLKRHKYQHLQEEALLKARGLLARWEDGPVLLIEDLYRQAAGGGTASEDELQELRNYTPEALALRFSLRNDPRVLDAVRELWAIDTGPRDALGCIDQRAYTALFRRIAKSVNAEALPKLRRRRHERVDKTIHEDWTRDSKGEREMSFAAFFDSVFELADLWCETIDVDEYVTFLADVRDRISEKRAKRRGGGGSDSRQRVLRPMRRVTLLEEELTDESESSTSEDESDSEVSESDEEEEGEEEVGEDAEPEEALTGDAADEATAAQPYAHSSLVHRYLTETQLTESSNGVKQLPAALSHKTNSAAGVLGSQQQRAVKSAGAMARTPSPTRFLSAAYQQQQVFRQLEPQRQPSTVGIVWFGVDDDSTSHVDGSGQFATASTASSSCNDLSALTENTASQLPVTAPAAAATGGSPAGSKKSLQQTTSIRESSADGDSTPAAALTSAHSGRHTTMSTIANKAHKRTSNVGWAIAVAAAMRLETPSQSRVPSVAVHVVQSGIDGIVNSSNAARNTTAITQSRTHDEMRATHLGTSPSAAAKRLLSSDTRNAIMNLARSTPGANTNTNTLLAAASAGFRGVVTSAMHGSSTRTSTTPTHHDAHEDSPCLGSVVSERFHASETTAEGTTAIASAMTRDVMLPANACAGSNDTSSTNKTIDSGGGKVSAKAASTATASTRPTVLSVKVPTTSRSPLTYALYNGVYEIQYGAATDAPVQHVASSDSIAQHGVRDTGYYSYGASVRPSTRVARAQARGGSTAALHRSARERARGLPRMVSPIQPSAYRFSAQDGSGDNEASHSSGTSDVATDGRLDLSSSYTIGRYATNNSSIGNASVAVQPSAVPQGHDAAASSSLDVTANELSTSATPFWRGLESVRVSVSVGDRATTRTRTTVPQALQRVGIDSDAAVDGSRESDASGQQEPLQRQQRREVHDHQRQHQRQHQCDVRDSDLPILPWDTLDDDNDVVDGQDRCESSRLAADDYKPPGRSQTMALSLTPARSQQLQHQDQQQRPLKRRSNRPHRMSSNATVHTTASALRESPFVVTPLSSGSASASSNATDSCVSLFSSDVNCGSKGSGHSLASAASASTPAFPTLADESLHARTLSASHSETRFAGWRASPIAKNAQVNADFLLQGERKTPTRLRSRDPESDPTPTMSGTSSAFHTLSPLRTRTRGMRAAGSHCGCSREDPRPDCMLEHCEAAARIRTQAAAMASGDGEWRPQSPVFKMERHMLSRDARTACMPQDGDCRYCHQQQQCSSSCSRDLADDVTIVLNATHEIILRPRCSVDDITDAAHRLAPSRSEMMKRRRKYTFGKV